MQMKHVAMLLIAAIGTALVSCAPQESTVDSDSPASEESRAFVGFPEKLDKRCREGNAKIYDECSDQLELFNAARVRAAADGKVLLVSVGAEWCIWCHVFEAHINGGKEKFRYTYGSSDEPDARNTETIYEKDKENAVHAEALRQFVAENFVVAHIDIQFAPNSEAVLKTTGADKYYGDGIPFIFTVDREGLYVAGLNPDLVEKRRDSVDWYRGYARSKLIDQLKAMHDAALPKDSKTSEK